MIVNSAKAMILRNNFMGVGNGSGVRGVRGGGAGGCILHFFYISYRPYEVLYGERSIIRTFL